LAVATSLCFAVDEQHPIVTSVALWLAETESEAHYSWTDVHALKKRGLDLTDSNPALVSRGSDLASIGAPEIYFGLDSRRTNIRKRLAIQM
jgi:hypothetical protein